MLSEEASWNNIYLYDELINAYIQNSSNFTSEEKNLVGNYYNSYMEVQPELYLANVKDKTIASKKIDDINGLSYLDSIINNSDNNNFHENIADAITDPTLKSVFNKLASMPSLKKVTIVTPRDITAGILCNADMDRLIINIKNDYETAQAYYFTDYAFRNTSFNSIDIRINGNHLSGNSYSGISLEINVFHSVYAPNAKLTFPPIGVGDSSNIFDESIFDAIEFTYKNFLISSGTLPRVNKIIYPDGINEIVNYNNESTDIYFRGSEKTIQYFNPSEWKNVTWNYTGD